MNGKEKIIKGLNALYESMHKNQCYACSYEFIETAKEFGTEILAEAEEFIRKQPEIVLCKDCKKYFTSACPCCSSGDPYNDWTPEENWFCADGETK